MMMSDPEATGNSRTRDAICDATQPASPGHWSIDHLKLIVDRRLRILAPGAQIPPQWLHQAIAYSLLAPGKRIRPSLTLLTAFHFGSRDLSALDCACAIEMIHAASLIMDDLPAMDDALLRRGQPTAHRQFGEDMAILSGIALLNRAYGVIASADGLQDATRVELMRILSDAVGSNGLVGGQVKDLRERRGEMDRRRLEKLNQLKTGALFVASVEAGAVIAGAPAEMRERVRRFATDLGLSFQIADDLIDDASFAGKTGKDTGKDHGKATLISVLGKEQVCTILHQHLAAAGASLQEIGNPSSQLVTFAEASFAQLRTQNMVHG
jgi:geranylgeranyl diphosphate synthase, type II